MPIRDRQEFADYCLRQLGGGILQIEITPEQISDRIDDAIQFVHEYNFDGVQETYLKHKVRPSILYFSEHETGLKEKFPPQCRIIGDISAASAILQGWEGENVAIVEEMDKEFETGESIKAYTNTGELIGSFVLDEYSQPEWGDLDRGWIELPDNILGIVGVFPTTSWAGSRNIFSADYQMMLRDIWDMSSSQMQYYYQINQNLSMYDQILNVTPSFQFNRVVNRLEVNWRKHVKPRVGSYVLVKCRLAVDPDEYIKLYNERTLKKLATAYLKRQWGQNLTKFNGVQLPGGITMNGVEIYNDAMKEVETAENEIRSMYELPPSFMMG